MACRSINYKDPNKYYEILGVDPWATREDIRFAYRIKVKICHPDGSSPNPEKFKLLSQIYETLSDEVTRQAYNDTPKGFLYRDETQMQERKYMSPKDLEPKVDISPFFSYYGEAKYKDLAQEWYEILLAAAHALQIQTVVRISIIEIDAAHADEGILVIPSHIPPDYFIALRWVKRLGAKCQTAFEGRKEQ